MRIGILGSRGIPNAYGGFEQFAQHLSVALVQKEHEVFVYNSSLHPYKENLWQGVNIIHCKDWEDKFGTAGQFLYDLNCINDARKRNFKILLQLGYTSNSIWHWRWPKKSINIVNMDGLEWNRSQYSKLTQRFLKKAEAWAVKYADHLIADSSAIQEYLLSVYKKSSTYIPYGAEILNDYNEKLLEKFDLLPHQYYLLIARIEPENNIEMIIRGFLAAGKKFPFVIIGNAYNKYGKYLSTTYKDEKIKFIGAIYEQNLLNSFRHFSKIYFHGHSAGGTNPSLLEAMACGCHIASHKNIFNRAVLKNESDYFSNSKEVAELINSPGNEYLICERIQINLEKIKSIYNWDKVINDYEKLMLELLSKF